MKKTIKTLIELGYTVLTPKGYKKFSTPYVNIVDNKGITLVLKINEKKDEIKVVKFDYSREFDNSREFVIAQIVGYMKNKEQLKKSIDTMLSVTKMTLNNMENHIPEKLRGEKIEVKEDLEFEHSNQIFVDKEWAEMFIEFFDRQTININFDPKKSIPVEKKEKPKKRIFDYSIFIDNVIKEVLNSKDNIVIYDINDQMIAFDAYSNNTCEYLWTVFINLLSLTDDSIPFINNVNICDGSVSIYSIFNHTNNIDDFIRFYKNFVRDANCECE